MEKVKKIVLIGASGFVGSALLNEALNRGFEVTAVVRHPEKIKIDNENLVSAGTKKQFGILQKLMHRPDVESVICATDAG